MPKVFKIQFTSLNVDTHCRIFTQKDHGAFAFCGSFTIKTADLEDMRMAMPDVVFEERTAAAA